MPNPDVVVIGAGSAGVAAARELARARLPYLLVEARSRLGGRARTWTDPSGLPLDLGCGWLHSAPENEWAALVTSLGLTLDKTPPPWQRLNPQPNFPLADQREFRSVAAEFYERVDQAAERGADRAAAECLEPGGRWNALLNAVSSYINGVELDQLSVPDFARYRDTQVNWRAVEGYGALIETAAAGLDVWFDCPATTIDHSGPRIRIETAKGTIETRTVIVTVPTDVLARGTPRFHPALPDKIDAAAGLPLGLADKLFLRIDKPDLLPDEARLFGSVETTATGSYHLRPFGRPVIEGYFGGALARALEDEGEQGFAAFAIDQIAAILGNDIRPHLSLIAASRWANDPFALGSYSHAKVGHADARAVLAASVDDRLFFAGEAASLNDFSTAHGAYRTGVAAARAAIDASARCR